MATKKKQTKKARRGAKVAQKAKAAKARTKAKPKRKPSRAASPTRAKSPTRAASPRRSRRPTLAAVGSQSVETVTLKPRARTARAGAGGGDFGGVSLVEDADSESPDELLEEGQGFEAGVVSGVENAPNADKSEVRTHEVPQDDVPREYDDKDRP